METIIGFFLGLGASYLASWYVLIGLIVTGIFFEHNNSRGFAVFLGLVAIASSYFVFQPNLQEFVVGAVLYFFIGVFWSFWRYRKFVIAGVKRGRDKDYLKPHNHTDTIVAWIIIWPMSAVENLAADLIDLVTTFVSETLKGVYRKIYESAIAK